MEITPGYEPGIASYLSTMTKKCTKCLSVKDISQFDPKRGSYAACCKECRRASIRNCYAKRREYYKDRSRKRKAEHVAAYTEYKRSLRCASCGLSFYKEPFLCDFHHHAGDKEFVVATLRSNHIDFIMKETSKCTPLCANCHRREHHSRK